MSMLAQTRAATAAASRTPALPDSVRRKDRRGAARSRDHAVRSRQSDVPSATGPAASRGPDAGAGAGERARGHAATVVDRMCPFRPSRSLVDGSGRATRLRAAHAATDHPPMTANPHHRPDTIRTSGRGRTTMRKKLALLVIAFFATTVITAAPAQAISMRPAYDTNWPCEGC